MAWKADFCQQLLILHALLELVKEFVILANNIDHAAHFLELSDVYGQLANVVQIFEQQLLELRVVGEQVI